MFSKSLASAYTQSGWNVFREDVPVLPGTLLYCQRPERVTTPLEGTSKSFRNLNGGGGVRTHGSGVFLDGDTRPDDYKSSAIDRSATPPKTPDTYRARRRF